MIYRRYENINGGTNNLCIIEAKSHLLNHGLPFIATSEKGEKQAMKNLRQQVKRFIIHEEASDGLELGKNYMKYQLNKYMRYLGA